MRILICNFIAVLGLVAAVRADEPNKGKPVLTLPGRVVVKSAGKEIGELSGPTLAVAFSSDGKRLASVSSRGGVDLAKQPYPPLTTNDLPSASSAIKLWDARTGKELRDQLLELESELGFTRATFSPDGTRILSVSSDESPSKPLTSPVIKVWELSSGKELLRVRGREGRIKSIALSPDGRCVVAGGAHIKGWDFKTGRAVGQEEYIKVWDTSTGKELHTFVDMSGEALCLGISSDNQRLAVGTRNFADQIKANGIRGEARFWDLTTGKHLATWNRHGQYVRTLAYCPDGKRLALGIRTVDKEAPVKICDAETGRELLSLPDQGEASREAQAQQLAFSPDARFIAGVLSEQAKTAVKVWDAKTGELLRSLPAGDAGCCIVFAPDGARLAVGGHRGVTVWEVGP